LTVASNYDKTINQISSLVGSIDAIVGAAIIGSRAHQGADQSADLDLLIFADSGPALLGDIGWLAPLGRPWASAVDKSNPELPVLRLLLEDAVRLDLLILDADGLAGLEADSQRWLAAAVGRGFSVIKAGGPVPDELEQLAEQAGARPGRPAQSEFADLIGRFWIDVAESARLLDRGEIWSAKRIIDGPMKDAMIQLQAWIIRARRGMDQDTYWDGRHLEEWVGERFREHLAATLAPLDHRGAAQALVETIDQFRVLGIQAAQRWGLDYPESVDRRITVWVRTRP
jgi:aminoglycoside 6-adenylyltransferase